MQFAERFIRRPVLASMVSLGLVLVGVIGYTRLPVREFPDADSPVVTVTTFLQYFLHDVIHHLWDVTGQQDAAASLVLE